MRRRRARYLLCRSDGLIDLLNQCRSAEGGTEARAVARIVDERAFAKLKVRFAPTRLSWLSIVWGDYWVIGLAPDYSWAVVGDPSRNYLWVLARTPRLEDQTIAAARALSRATGYDVERLELTPHRKPANDAENPRQRQDAEGLHHRGEMRFPPPSLSEAAIRMYRFSEPLPGVESAERLRSPG
jgi:lipocalin